MPRLGGFLYLQNAYIYTIYKRVDPFQTGMGVSWSVQMIPNRSVSKRSVGNHWQNMSIDVDGDQI